MASTLACLGLDAFDDESGFERFTGGLAARATPIARWDGITVARWQDPSGARLTFAIEDNRIEDFVPGFDGPAGAHFSAFSPLNDEVVSVSVADADGEQLTGMAVELEERHLLPAWPGLSGPVAVTALGVGISVHPDEEAFAASDDSLLSPRSNDDGPPPPRAVETGLKWPPRVASESFFSYGVFGEAAEAESFARLSGVVLASERRVVRETDRSFVVARVRTVGFEANLCLPGATDDPPVGAIISGTVWLSAHLTAPPAIPPSTPTRPRRRWWRR